MKLRNRLLSGILGLGLASCVAHAQNEHFIDWIGTTGDFFNPANWQDGVVPGVGDIARISNGGTATIGVSAGTFALSGIRLGVAVEGIASPEGHIIMNGGTLNLSATVNDTKAQIGASSILSTFIMNGGTINFDGPDQFPGASEDGVNGLDWEVGELGKGRFEMHGGSFFGSDDLKVAENAAGIGYAIIDGNSHFAVGSGISVGGGNSPQLEELVIAGNALVEAGNSLGAGNPQGMSDEGYLTMSTSSSNSKLTIKENGVLNIRRLTSREGTSWIEVMDHGQFHIFDVLHGKGFINSTTSPDRPEETGPNSTYASAPSTATLILRDDALMTVNSTQGLGISAPRDAGNAGGTATMIIRDRASFTVNQSLKVGTAASATSIGTVEVVGGNAKVIVGGNLALAFDEAALAPTPGQGTLSVVITGSTHSAVEVTNTAYLANGTLKISTENFQPALDATFRILKAANIDGTFKAVDVTGAKLATGLAFAVIYNPDSVDLKVVQGAGRPEDNGVTAKTDTIYVNPPSLLNNDNTESIGVAIASNGNVLVGWEDDGDLLQDTEAAWMLYSPDGVLLNQAVDITTLNPAAPGATINSVYRSFFRANGDPTPHYTAWGPKIKANLFGAGLGMGATAFDLGIEVPELAPVNNNAAGDNAGDFPAVQLLTDTGAPVKIVSWSDADAEPDGDIRIGDWDYLANGNILIVGEDRQAEEQTRLGAPTDRQPVFKIVTQANVEVKGLTLASSSAAPDRNDMWHGSAVTATSFGIRAARSLRFFNNDGTPLGDNVDVETLTGDAVYVGGTDRGESVPFHGNGKDAYVLAALGTDKNGVRGVFVTVFNADGTLRWATNGTAGLTITATGRVDAAIDQQGRVVFVYTDVASVLDGTKKTVRGRILDNTGKALGGAFLISDTEIGGENARVAWRGDTIAVTWESQNVFNGQPDPAPNPEVVALRLFTVASAGDITATITRSGNNVTITWTGGTGLWVIQKKISLDDATWMNVASTSQRTVTLPAGGDMGFFRVVEGVATTGITTMSASLSGANERPTPVTSTGSGFGTLALEGNTLTFDISFKDLGSNAKLMHIHGYGTTEEAKPVIIDLMPFLQGPLAKSGRIKGSVTLDATQKAGILAGQTYVNVHSDLIGSGELRGQIVQ
jgi:hypothetical protein